MNLFPTEIWNNRWKARSFGGFSDFTLKSFLNTSASSLEVEIFSWSVITGGKEVLQKFREKFLARNYEDFMPLGLERTLCLLQQMNLCLY